LRKRSGTVSSRPRLNNRKSGQEIQEKARRYVFRLLSYRERSREEVAEKLRRKKFPAAVIKETLDYFERVELIDDERFARLWVRSRLNANPRSSWLISRELSRKGVEKELIERVVKEEILPGKEKSMALRLARKRWRHYENDPETAARRKIFSYLARRGFSPGLIVSVVEEITSRESTGD